MVTGQRKKALHKDFWMEIRKNKARFISIFCIVALGVAFFSGIQATSPDMRLSGDAYYSEKKLMDIKVVGTLGLTDDDVQALSQVDGVETAEGAYSTDVTCGGADSLKVLHVESLNKNLNKLTVTEGRVPEKSGECFLDSTFADAQGYKVGDSITFAEDGDSELLKTKTYTIAGLGKSPLYISFNRGNTTIGSGEVNGFAYILPEDFDSEVYTQIYILAHGTDQVTSYTDAYDNLIEKVQTRVEGIADERCQIRYDEVRSEAEDKIADAEKELEDGKKEADEELADARKKLEDGEKELSDGKKEYEDGKQQLSDAKKELEDGKQQIADAKKTLEDGQAQIASAREELESGRSQLEDAKQQLADGQAQLESGQKKLDEGWEQYNSGKKQYDEGLAQLKSAKKELEDGKAQIASARTELDKQEQDLKSKQTQLEEGKKTASATIEQLNGQISELKAGLDQAEASAEQASAQLGSCQSALEAAQAAVSEKQTAVNAASEKQTAAQTKLDQASTEEEKAAAQSELDQAAAELSEANTALSEANTAVSEAQTAYDTANSAVQQAAAAKNTLTENLTAAEAGLQKAQAVIDQAPQNEAQITEGLKTIETTRAQLTEKEQTLTSGAAEITKNEKTLAESKKKLDESYKTLSENQKTLDEKKKELTSGQAEITASEQKLASGEAEIAANEQKLNEGAAEIAANEQKITDGEKEIKENEQKLKDAEQELKDAEKELADGKKDYADGEKKAQDEIKDGEQKIADAKKELDDLDEPEWMVTDRNDLPEYSDYGDNADRIKSIGKVFPVIFFLVAALISLTTMTRMVEEQRTQIGTLKALGYGKGAIASKYLSYAFLATVGGSIVGILIGEKILPYIIIKAYGIMYHNVSNNLEIHYELKFGLMASAAAVICTVGATVFSCSRTLAETPASLMRPPAPKEGKRILLERIPIIWKHLNFTWKSSMRNLFRYKKRLLMTIFGIAGSMGLMLVGYGIRDSITDIVRLQYTELQHYDGTIIADEDATDAEREELNDYLAGNDELDHYTNIQLTKVTAPHGKSNISVYLYVPEDLKTFKKDVTLRNRISHEEYELTDDGAVICEKTASLLNLKIGDFITVEKDNQEYQIKVAVITENYAGHYVYLTPEVYEETFGEKPDFPDTVFTVKDEYADQTVAIGQKIMEYPAALSISYTTSTMETVERMLSTLDVVIIVLIVSAGMLAFVVLYNLNNINITERQRELATLKVLGFYDLEVSQYVLRENILLTLLGILVGSGFGIFLHRYIIVTVEVDAVMFGRNIQPLSFIYCALLTILFSVVVNIFMHLKLKKIDMVESLKSVE